MTVHSQGTSYLTWSEGNSYNGPGSTWWARNHLPQPSSWPGPLN